MERLFRTTMLALETGLRVVQIAQFNVKSCAPARRPATFLLTAHSLILTRFPCVTNRASSAFWNADVCRRHRAGEHEITRRLALSVLDVVNEQCRRILSLQF
jgi:hypothetical protein